MTRDEVLASLAGIIRNTSMSPQDIDAMQQTWLEFYPNAALDIMRVCNEMRASVRARANAEPTEEQRAAAATHVLGVCLPVIDWVRTGRVDDTDNLDACVDLARLLAEREAKLRERQETMKGLIAALDEDRATLQARAAELENSLAACRGTLFADDRYNEARTREAVMPSFDCGGENCGRISCSDCTDDALHARYWQELGKGPGGDAGAEHRARAWWTTEGKRLKAASEREAQHLARIAELEAKANEACRWCAEEDYCDCLGCGGRLPVVCVVGGKCARCGGTEREAQHLADIKALRPLFERVKEAQFETYEDAYRAIYKCGGYDLVKQVDAVFARYDDAKAAEGGVDRITKGET